MCSTVYTSLDPSTFTPAQRISLGLETPEDLDLLATQPHLADPHAADPRYASLFEEQDLYPEEPLLDPHAIAMRSAGFPEARCRKIEVCGQFAHATYCDNNHFDSLRIGFCGEMWSICCRDRYAKTRLKAWQKVIDHIQEFHPQHHGKSVFVEIRMDSPQDAAFALAQLSELKDKVNALRDETIWFREHDHQVLPCPTWSRMCGVLDDTLVLRILIDDAFGNHMSLIPPKRWKELWPGAKVSVHVDSEANFAQWFWRLLQPLKIDDPESCAWHAKEFSRRKLLRSDHMETLCEPIQRIAKELEAQADHDEQTVDSNTIYSESWSPTDNKGDTPKAPQEYPACRHCGLPVKNKSSHLKVHSPELRAILEKLHQHLETS